MLAQLSFMLGFDDEREQPQRDVALICLNGHVINDSFQGFPEFNTKRCKECGEETINGCPQCKTSIQGHLTIPGVIGGYHFTAPNFCHECGKAYPWTERKLAAAKELAQELDGLTDDDKVKLQGAIQDLVTAGPKAEPAQFRFKNIMKKVGKEGYDLMKTIVSDVVSEAVKKSIYGP